MEEVDLIRFDCSKAEGTGTRVEWSGVEWIGSGRTEIGKRVKAN